MKSIELRSVSFEYPGGFLAVDDVSMEFETGESVAIIGQNGAGKTTTVKMMNNLYRPTQGTVFVEGDDTTKFTTAQIARRVGYVFQNPDDQIFQPDVAKEISYSAKVNKIDPAVAKKWFDIAVELTGLGQELQTNPYNLPLSLRKFVTVACVIAMNPNVIILDEPTAGQDLNGLDRISTLIKELRRLGKTVITITHDMDFVVGNFDHVIVMANKKKVADGTIETIFWNHQLMEKADLKPPAICSLAARLDFAGEIVNEEQLISQIQIKNKRCQTLKGAGLLI